MRIVNVEYDSNSEPVSVTCEDDGKVYEFEIVKHARPLEPYECGGKLFGPCSICGAWYDVMQGTNDGDFYYCPNCGAKFDL